VDDCVNALLLAGSSDISNGKVYNLGSSEVIKLKDLAKKMTDLGFGGEFKIVPFPEDRKAIDIGDYYSDYSLINKELGWEPKVSLMEGLKKTVKFYESHGKHYF
jgi:UDP-glucose 4-epimerase